MICSRSLQEHHFNPLCQQLSTCIKRQLDYTFSMLHCTLHTCSHCCCSTKHKWEREWSTPSGTALAVQLPNSTQSNTAETLNSQSSRPQGIPDSSTSHRPLSSSFCTNPVNSDLLTVKLITTCYK